MQQPLAELWDWQLRACCRGFSPNVFFPPTSLRHSELKRREATAKSICADCTVRSICLDHALTSNEKFGVWGGLTTAERQRITYDPSTRIDEPRLSSA